MTKTKKTRKSLTFPRLQPFEDTPMAVIADYLNTMEAAEVKKLLQEILVMYFLPVAQSQLGGFSPQQVKNSYLISRRMAENHFGFMALELGLDALVYTSIPLPFSAAVNPSPSPSQESVLSTSTTTQSDAPNELESNLIPGDMSTGFIDNLFG